MRIKVSIHPVAPDELSADLKEFHIPVPGFLIKGALSFKTQVEKAGMGIARTMLKKKNYNIQIVGRIIAE